MTEIKWDECDGSSTPEDIIFLQKKIKFSIPKSFLNLLLECDAGTPQMSYFYFSTNKESPLTSKSMGGFLGIRSESYNIIETYENPPEFFPKNLVAFAETGSGDFLCFDYRNNIGTNDPPIVYWKHDSCITEEEVGKKDTFNVAKNFKYFLEMLHDIEE